MLRLTVSISQIKECVKNCGNCINGGIFRTPTAAEIEAANTCTICQESLINPMALPCNHIFCETCITEWFYSSRVPTHNCRLLAQRLCPLCRSDVTVGEYARGYNGATSSLVPYM